MAEAPWRQAAVPPPPPPGATGQIPAAKLKSEVSDRRAEPPLCVQNAMLTKDKKPFTYTPGGIDLSEIRSPRMARRLERNALNEGVSPMPPGHYHPSGPLPPSALAAMQPQLPVQVFPSGAVPQLPHGGPPAPPPPPPKAPPMKTSPLPTDVYDRPDMTKIIPDNPMALLRKTAGPVVKQDPILNQCKYSDQNTPVQPVVQPERQQPSKPSTGIGSIYVPPINAEQSPPVNHSPPAYYKRQPSIPQPESPKPPPQVQPTEPNSPKPSLSKAPTPWLTQRRQQSQDVPEWAINDQRVQSPQIQQEPWIPPEKQEPPPQPKPVRPWQQQQHPEPQPWQTAPQPPAHYQQPQQFRTEPSSPGAPRGVHAPQPPAHYQQPQQFRPEPSSPGAPRGVHAPQPPAHYQQPQQFRTEPSSPGAPRGVRKQMENREIPQEYYPSEKTEVVIVNEPPFVYQHPGQPQQRVPYQEPGVRVIPVQIEGRTGNGQVRSPLHNSDARSFNRQDSTPTQSNTFRVLQKITQTDGDDDENQIATEHSPKMYHQFPADRQQQQRKWNQGGGDAFRQVPQEHHQQVAAGPKVRTIPIQIEGNGSTKNYIPPSEQIVQEPKKYMGSSIPSRSFKMLQAMTAPDECGPGQSDL